MCGRYTITQDLKELEKLVKFVCKMMDFSPRYNLAPRQKAPVLVFENNEIILKPMRWGLIPSWAKDETIGDKLINARAETLTEKSSFKRPFQKQRCLIPADGFYEWQTTSTGKIPFRFTRKDGGFFCLAGLWERWTRKPKEEELALGDAEPLTGQVVESFTVITTTPNLMVAAVHDRMPVILTLMSPLILHLPHASRIIPERYRGDFLLDDAELAAESIRLVDTHTDALYGAEVWPGVVLAAEISRFVVDVERFAADVKEPCSRVGMGATYVRTSDGRELRRLSSAHRAELLEAYYYPHHAAADRLASERIDQMGRCLLLDAHS